MNDGAPIGERPRLRSIGQIYFWEGCSLWIGRHNGATSRHEHHAIQLSLALQGSFALRGADSGAWTPHRAAIVPPHVPHALDAFDVTAATIFVEPESAEGRILIDRFAHDGMASLPERVAEPAADALRRALREAPTEEGLVAASRQVIGILTEGGRSRRPLDPRIEQAITLVRARLDRPIAQEAVASEVFLSASRFRHLFAEQTGMAFRPYVLWLRLHRALRAYTRGETLTNAAHAAGFSDLAHLSRTFRRMFGMTLTTLVQDERLSTVSRQPSDDRA